MTFVPQGSHELANLLDIMVDHDLNSVQIARLNEILRCDADAMRFYREYLALHATMAWDTLEPISFASLQGICGVNDRTSAAYNVRDRRSNGQLSVSRVLSGSSLRQRPLRLAVASLAIVGVFWTFWGYLIYADRNDHQGRRKQSTMVSVATLSAERDCVWEPDPRAEAPHVGQRLRADEALVLRSGVAKVTFETGVVMHLEGPSRLVVDSSNRCLLEYGKTLAKVSQRAIGFCIATPTVDVVDLGTEFGVNVSKQGVVEVAVLAGKVEVGKSTLSGSGPDQDSNKKRTVSAGQAITVRRSEAGRLAIDQAKFDEAAAVAFSEQLKSKSRLPARAVAYGVSDGTPGNQRDFHGGVGLDFDVHQPIRVFSLGVFDHLGDGIDPSTSPVVQLWSRNPQDTPNETIDDIAGVLLASTVFTTREFGELKHGHRFKSLTKPIDLPAGTYSVVAYGLSDANPFVVSNDVDHDVDFTNDPGWTGSNNSANGNRFGWSSSTNKAHGKTGEAGGTFARLQIDSYFGDTRLTNALSFDDKISASGKFDISNVTTGWAGNGDSGFFIGHFSTKGAKNEAFIGLEFKEDGSGRTNLMRVKARFNFWSPKGNHHGASSADACISANGHHTFRYTYDPHLGDSGRLTVNIDGQPALTADLTDGDREILIPFDAFGMGFTRTFNSENDPAKTVEVFLDDVSYTGFRATPSRSVRVLDSRRPLTRVETLRDSILPVGARCGTADAGVFPVMQEDRPIGCVAGSFEYSVQEEDRKK